MRHIRNSEVAETFNLVANLLDIQGANPFRVRAYRNAARVVAAESRSVAEMAEREHELETLPGVGRDLAGKIAEIVHTGELSMLKELEKKTPASLTSMMRIPALGPKRIRALFEGLGIKNLEELKAAAEAGKIKTLPGFSAKTEKRILEEIAKLRKRGPERVKWAEAEDIVSKLVPYLEEVEGVKRVIVAGSFRRKRETVGDLDILVTCKKGSSVMERFIHYPEVREIVSHGPTRSIVILRSGIQVDVRVVPERSYGAALHYFTGAKNHTITIRAMAIKKGLKINEYGVYRGHKRIAGLTEEEVYRTVGLPYIEPELREGRGEIEAAQKGKLPKLIELKDLRGDLHAHTTATDGRNTLEEMAKAARELGYEYLAITDHSERLTVASGLNEERLMQQIREIDRLNEKLNGIVILKAIEVDIMEDGRLDLPDRVLQHLDLRVCSIHYKFNLSREKQTERLLRAMDSPYCNIIGHLTGRLINQRDAYDLDFERVFEAAKERGVFLEINAQPERLDIDDRICRQAKEMGLKFAISSDAHSTESLKFIRFGVNQARRGWIEANDVINTRPLKELRRLLQRI